LGQVVLDPRAFCDERNQTQEAAHSRARPPRRAEPPPHPPPRYEVLPAACAAERVRIFVEMNPIERATAEYLAQRGQRDFDVIDVMTDREGRVDRRSGCQELADRSAYRFEGGEILHPLGRAKHLGRKHAVASWQWRIAPDPFVEVEPAMMG